MKMKSLHTHIGNTTLGSEGKGILNLSISGFFMVHFGFLRLNK